MLQLNHFPSFVEFVSDSTLNDTLIHLFCRSSSKTCLKFKSMTPFVEQWQPDQNTDQAEMLLCSDQQGPIQSLSKENARTHTHTLPIFRAEVFLLPPTNKIRRLQWGERHAVWCPQQDTGSQKWRCKSRAGLQHRVKCGPTLREFPLMQVQYINGKSIHFYLSVLSATARLPHLAWANMKIHRKAICC